MTPMGSLHPILFFAGIYVVALLFSIFICSTLFYSCNASASQPALQQQEATSQNDNQNIGCVSKPLHSFTFIG